MTEAPVVVAEGLVKSYGSVRALDGLSIEIGRGTTGVLGPNGAGKSTFLKVLLGLARPDRGRASVLGVDVAAAGGAIRSKVGYMPESDGHLPGLNAVDTVALCGELSGLRKAEAFRRAHETLHFCGLSEARYRPVDGFSAGLKQRVKFAAALVHDPDLLVLDEPTNGLDPAGRREFLDLVAEAARRGVSILLSTHLLPDVQAVADRAVVVARGRVLRSGSVAELTRAVAGSRVVRFTGDAAAFLGALVSRGVRAEHDATSGDLRVVLPDGATNRVVLEAAVESGVGLKRLADARESLEDVFLEAVGSPE